MAGRRDNGGRRFWDSNTGRFLDNTAKLTGRLFSRWLLPTDASKPVQSSHSDDSDSRQDTSRSLPMPVSSDPSVQEIYDENADNIRRLQMLFPDEHLSDDQRRSLEWVMSAAQRGMSIDLLDPAMVPLGEFEFDGATHSAVDIMRGRYELREGLVRLGVALQQHEFPKFWGGESIRVLQEGLASDDLTDKERGDYQAVLDYLYQRHESLSRLSAATWASVRYISRHGETEVVRQAHERIQELREFKGGLFDLQAQLIGTQYRLEPTWLPGYERDESRSKPFSTVLTELTRDHFDEVQGRRLSFDVRGIDLAPVLVTNELMLGLSETWTGSSPVEQAVLGLSKAWGLPATVGSGWSDPRGFGRPKRMGDIVTEAGAAPSGPADYERQLHTYLTQIAKSEITDETGAGVRLARLLVDVSGAFGHIEALSKTRLHYWMEMYSETLYSPHEYRRVAFEHGLELIQQGADETEIEAWVQAGVTPYDRALRNVFRSTVGTATKTNEIVSSISGLTEEQLEIFGITEDQHQAFLSRSEQAVAQYQEAQRLINEGLHDATLTEDEHERLLQLSTEAQEEYHGVLRDLAELASGSMAQHLGAPLFPMFYESEPHRNRFSKERHDGNLKTAAVKYALKFYDRSWGDAAGFTEQDIISGVTSIVSMAGHEDWEITYYRHALSEEDIQLQWMLTNLDHDDPRIMSYRRILSQQDMRTQMYPHSYRQQLEAQGIDTFQSVRRLEQREDVGRFTLAEVQEGLAARHGPIAPTKGAIATRLGQAVSDTIDSEVLQYSEGVERPSVHASLLEAAVANEHVRRIGRENLERKLQTGHHLRFGDTFYEIEHVAAPGESSERLEEFLAARRHELQSGGQFFDELMSGVSMGEIRSMEALMGGMRRAIALHQTKLWHEAQGSLAEWLGKSPLEFTEPIGSDLPTDTAIDELAQAGEKLHDVAQTRMDSVSKFLESTQAYLAQDVDERTDKQLKTIERSISQLQKRGISLLEQDTEIRSAKDVRRIDNKLRDWLGETQERLEHDRYLESTSRGFPLSGDERRAILEEHFGGAVRRIAEVTGQDIYSDDVNLTDVLTILQHEREQREVALTAYAEQDSTLGDRMGYDVIARRVEFESAEDQELTVTIGWDPERTEELGEFVGDWVRPADIDDVLIDEMSRLDAFQSMDADSIRQFAALNQAVFYEAEYRRSESFDDVKLTSVYGGKLPFTIYSSTHPGEPPVDRVFSLPELFEAIHGDEKIRRSLIGDEQTRLIAQIRKGDFPNAFELERWVESHDIAQSMSLNLTLLMSAYGKEILSSGAALEDFSQAVFTTLYSRMSGEGTRPQITWADLGIEMDHDIDPSQASVTTYSVSDIYARLIEYLKQDKYFMQDVFEEIAGSSSRDQLDVEKAWLDVAYLRQISSQIDKPWGDISESELIQLIRALSVQEGYKNLRAVQRLSAALESPDYFGRIYAMASGRVPKMQRFIGIEGATEDDSSRIDTLHRPVAGTNEVVDGEHVQLQLASDDPAYDPELTVQDTLLDPIDLTEEQVVEKVIRESEDADDVPSATIEIPQLFQMKGARVERIEDEEGNIAFQVVLPLDEPGTSDILKQMYSTFIDPYKASGQDFKITQTVGGRKVEIAPSGVVKYADSVAEHVAGDVSDLIRLTFYPEHHDRYEVFVGDAQAAHRARMAALERMESGTELPIFRRVEVPTGAVRHQRDQEHGRVYEFVEPETLIRTATRFANHESSTLTLDVETLGLATEVPYERGLSKGIPSNAFGVLQLALLEQTGVSGENAIMRSYLVQLPQESRDYVLGLIEALEGDEEANLNEDQMIMLRSLRKYAIHYGYAEEETSLPEAARAGLKIFDASDSDHEQIREHIEAQTQTVDGLEFKEKIISTDEAATILEQTLDRNQLLSGQNIQYELAVIDYLFRRARVGVSTYDLLKGKNVLDTMTLARVLLPAAGSYQLGDVAREYGYVVDEDELHFAPTDTMVTAKVLGRQLADIADYVDQPIDPYGSRFELDNLHVGDILMARSHVIGARYEDSIYAKSFYRLAGMKFGSAGESDAALSGQTELGQHAVIAVERLDSAGQSTGETVFLEDHTHGAVVQQFHEIFDPVRYQTEPGVFSGMTEEDVARFARISYMDRARRVYHKAALDNPLSSVIREESIGGAYPRTERYLPGADIYEIVKALAQQADGVPISDEMTERIERLQIPLHEQEQLVAAAPRARQDEILHKEVLRILREYAGHGIISPRQASAYMHELYMYLDEHAPVRKVIDLPKEDFRMQLFDEPLESGAALNIGGPHDITVYSSTTADRDVSRLIWHIAQRLQREQGLSFEEARRNAQEQILSEIQRKGILTEEDMENIQELSAQGVAEGKFDSVDAARSHYARQHTRLAFGRFVNKLDKVHKKTQAGEVLSKEEQALWDQVVTSVHTDTLEPRTPEEMEKAQQAASDYGKTLEGRLEVIKSIVERIDEVDKSGTDLSELSRTLMGAMQGILTGSGLTDDQRELLLLTTEDDDKLSPEVQKAIAQVQRLLGLNEQAMRVLLGSDPTSRPATAQEAPVNRSGWSSMKTVGRMASRFLIPFVMQASLQGMGAFISNAAVPYDMRAGDAAPGTDGIFDPIMPGSAYHQMLPHSYMAPEGGAGYSGVRFKVSGTASSQVSQDQLQASIRSAIGESVPGPINTNIHVRDTSYKIDKQWLDNRIAELIG